MIMGTKQRGASIWGKSSHDGSMRKGCAMGLKRWGMCAALLLVCANHAARAAELSASNIIMEPGDTADVVVSGAINGESTFGVTIVVELVPRAGAAGTLTFTAAPPVDIVQAGDPWPGTGTFSRFDTDQTGFAVQNGSVDDNGTFTEAPVTFSGALSRFPVVASAAAMGTWDVLLTTGSGDSTWEGSTVTTNRVAGTVTVLPSSSLAIVSLSMPPGATVNVVTSGSLNGESTFGVTLLVELIPRAGTTGTLTFTSAPPVDIVQLGDPWPGAGTFSRFDTNSTGSTALNGSLDDNGTFVAGPVTFTGSLTGFPVVASGDASGVWDVTLSTSAGDSSWEGLLTGLIDGTVTVVAGACVDNAECGDGNLCTTDTCASGTCQNVNNTIACNDGNACTSGDACSGGTCVGTVVPNGTTCDDGALCTVSDVCTGGACAGVLIDCSSESDACNVGSCNPATGVCKPDPANEGGPCDDGDPCTAADSCEDGFCVGTPIQDNGACDDGDLCTESDDCQNGVCSGKAVDCSDLNDGCNIGACNPATGFCQAVVMNEGGPCDDGDFCTTGDLCSNGVCAGTPIPEGQSCDDGSLCTLNETCFGGVCVGTAIDCSSQNGPCTMGVCNAQTGQCSAQPINEGLTCDDGNLCTLGDTCVVGACTATPVDCSSFDGPCAVGTCNFSTGQCESAPVGEGGACNDNNACTVSDVCTAGACAGTPRDCTSLNGTCTQGVCNALNGNCQSVAINENGTCNDNLRCTNADRCVAGTCTGTPTDCSSLNTPCTVGSCNPSSGACQSIPANEGGACNDNLACTTDDVCVNGTCSGTLTSPPRINLSLTPVHQSVSVGATFTVDLVASSGTCANQPWSSAEVILTWDSTRLALTGFSNPGPHSSSFPDDSDLDGLNAPFTGLPANDGDCQYLAFAGISGAVAAPPGGMLLTRLTFTALDGTTGTQIVMPSMVGLFSHTRVLGAGSTAGQDITGTHLSAAVVVTECTVSADCNDNNVCTTDTCTASRLCTYANNSISCNDGLFCTPTDTCSGGVCVGSGVRCSGAQHCSETLDACVQCLNNGHCEDSNPCTTNTCNAVGACTFPNNNNACNDGLFCTLNDVCGGGTCNGSGVRCPGQLCDEPNDRCVQCLSNPNCNDNNICTTDTCNVAAGTCVYNANSNSCNDGLFCTLTDTCGGGTCNGSGVRCPGQLCNEDTNTCVNCIVNADCASDNNPCTDDQCLGGNCFYVNNIAACNDGLFCTLTDVCSGGACVGSGNRCPGELCDEGRDRCAECIVDTDCTDTVGCTIDHCLLQSGNCENVPNHAICSNGVFCDGAETCNTTTGCSSPGNPCDSPGLCNEGTDTCGCAPPTVVAEGCRAIRVVPSPGATPVAILVTGQAGDPRVGCISRYVQTNGTLSTSPVFRTPAQWGAVHISDSEVIPSASYQVRSDCRVVPTDPANPSTPVSTTTWLWGDVNHDGNPNFQDITLTVDGFRNIFVNASLQATDLHDCVPNRLINFSDITWAVDGFRNFVYPCTNPCP